MTLTVCGFKPNHFIDGDPPSPHTIIQSIVSNDDRIANRDHRIQSKDDDRKSDLFQRERSEIDPETTTLPPPPSKPLTITTMTAISQRFIPTDIAVHHQQTGNEPIASYPMHATDSMIVESSIDIEIED